MGHRRSVSVPFQLAGLDHGRGEYQPKQILIPALPNVVSEALGKHKIPGNRLELEVTEGVFLGDSGKTVDVLERLRALGVGIALDDFGTGYSSIGYLNKAIFHKLKIDGSFVREAGSSRRTSLSSSLSYSLRRASACR
jgi:EAL domain-containing protein (putative c-di-GMP-specific phosphodiesterase class I)